MPTTGIELKLERVALRVRVKELAFAMKVSETRISNIEAQHVVTDEAARRYRAALSEVPTFATSNEPTGAA